MRRWKSAVAALIVLPELAAGIELPRAPAGFSWHEVPAVRAAFLVPEGWYYKEEVQGKTRAVFITQEDLATKGSFETGVSINIFTDNPSAAAQITEILEKAAGSHSVKLSQVKMGPFVKLSCEFESPREAGLEPVRIFMIGLVNIETGTSYLVSLESPSSAWGKTWPKGKTILDALALESEV